jgi:ATP-dependent Clp protease ATP-binding subunit ClpC
MRDGTSMFERYSESARRVIYFSRSSANALGSSYIDTEHLLLGLLKENGSLVKRFAQRRIKEVRAEIEKQITCGKPLPASTNLLLTNETKVALMLATDSADRAGARRVGPKHILLGILRTEECGAARILTKKRPIT